MIDFRPMSDDFKPMPALMFTFVPTDAVIHCDHCDKPIDVSEGKPLAFWGMNGAALHRECADAYIAAQGWKPAIFPGFNKYVPVAP